MAARSELAQFNRRNRAAVMFAEKALHDYLYARYGIQGGFLSAFEMSTQAVEKLLKSYLLFKDPHCAGSAEKLKKALIARSKALGRSREPGHDVEAALDMAAGLGLSCSADLRGRLGRINTYYAGRYPDSSGPGALYSTELQDIDEAVFEIWDSFQAINPDYYYVCGISMPVYSFLMNGTDERNRFGIMSTRNLSYARRKEFIEAGIKERCAAWFDLNT
jgi:HEPN domain-containing protein